MKKVLFVINTLGHAGAEVAMLELLRRMQGMELDISVYVLTEQGELRNRLQDGIHFLNKKYCDTSVLSKEGRKHLAKKVIRASFKNASLFRNIPYLCSNLFEMIKKGRIQVDKLLWRVLSDGSERFDEEYDLAISFLEGGSAYYVHDHVKAKKKAAFIHIDYNLAGYTRKLDKNCYLDFDKVFTVSDECREHFVKAYPECDKFAYAFHNMLNEVRILTMAKEGEGFTDDFDGYRILTVGRLVYQKAYDIAIEAMKLIKEAGYHIRWYVLGEGELRKELEKQIEKEGLNEDFVLLGAHENPYPYYAKADLYAHFTRFEGKSIAIQEAQVLSKPIVASDCSGNREQIENDVDGLLCKLTPDQILKAVEYMFLNPEDAKRMGKKASYKQRAYEKDIDMLLELLN